MDHYADERDLVLLESDRYTFAVLSRILQGPCDLVLTDHTRFILCHSAAPYPVWIWTPDALSPQEMQRIWELSEEVRPLSAGHRCNLKYELAEFFIAKAKEQGLHAGISTNLFAYDCPAPIAPAHPADGNLHRCTAEDVEETAALIHQFHHDIGENRLDMEACRMQAAQHIEAGRFFLWRNAAGTTVACCHYSQPDGTLASLSGVYTRPEFRRRHYAQNLVYQVTRIVSDSGLTPMLYTDADYAASNACYEKIGYILRGKLCTIKA